MAGFFGTVTKQAMPIGTYDGKAIYSQAEWDKIHADAMGGAMTKARNTAYANLDLQETEDRIAENRQQSERNNAFAFAQARQNRAVGGGRGRSKGTRLPAGTLASSNAKALADARRKKLEQGIANLSTWQQKQAFMQSGQLA